MDNYAKITSPNTLQLERILPGPIERVWEYITDSEKRGLWFASGKLEPVEGGKMELIFNNSTLSFPPDKVPEKYKEFDDGYVSSAIVVKCDPPHVLVINWEDGLITFALQELEDKVRLTLTHEKLPEDSNQRIGAIAGWHTHLDILVDRMNNRDPKGFWTVHMSLEQEYGRKFG